MPFRRNDDNLQFDALRKFMSSGGNLLVMVGEGGERRSDTNINFLLEEFGITVRSGTDMDNISI